MLKRFSLYLFVFFSCELLAQISSGGFPYPERIETTVITRSSRSETIELPPIDTLSSDDESMRVGGTQFAYRHNVNLSPENSGTILVDSLGTKIWRVRIKSEGAYSLNVIFNRFVLQEGEKVFLYTPSRSHIIGAFTERNNLPQEILATAPVNGDEIIVEYISPKGCQGELSIGSVNHDYVGVRKLPSIDNSLYCQTDVTCEEGYLNEKRSTVLIIINGTTYCSGNLINNTAHDGTPYLLTASHCFNYTSLSKSEQLAATCVFFFNYQSPYCIPGIRGNMEMSISGASVKAFDGDRDLTLLQLSSQPPVDYMPFYAGWDASDALADSVYCVHHPEGDLKKISHDYDVPQRGTFLCNGMFAADGHWIIDFWDEGLTENGSSGSALFNQEGRIIGALSGGYSDVSCEQRGFDAFYRLGIVWEDTEQRTGLITLLDPTNSGSLICEGLEPYRRGCRRITNFSAGDELYSTKTEEEFLIGHNSLNIRHFAERFSTEKGGEVFGIHFIPESGTYSADYPIYVHIFSGDERPEDLLHSQLVKLQNKQYASRVGEIQTRTLESLYRRDNYLRFDSPVVVDSTFFVVFELPETYEDPFALYHVKSPQKGNISFFKYNGEWDTFENHPTQPSSISMMVQPIIRRPEKTDVEDLSSNFTKVMVTPNPSSGDLSLYVGSTGEVIIELYDLSGRLIFYQVGDSTEYNLSSSIFTEKGIYLLKITSNAFVSTHKIIRE